MIDPNPAPAGPVRVSTMGADSATLDFEPGLTVHDYLERADTDVAHDALVTLNGAPADPTTPVPANSVLVVTAKIRNG